MSFWDAASLAAAITIALIGFAANKILDVDFTVFFRRNWKRTKCKKMLAQRKGPWQGTNVQGEIRRAFDLVLLPLGKADKALLPARMDKNFRRRMEGQIELLQRRKLCRDIRMTDIVPLPKNSFRHWNWSACSAPKRAGPSIPFTGKTPASGCSSPGTSAAATAPGSRRAATPTKGPSAAPPAGRRWSFAASRPSAPTAAA